MAGCSDEDDLDLEFAAGPQGNQRTVLRQIPADDIGEGCLRPGDGPGAPHGIRLPRNLLLLLKTFIQTEALGKILGSDASILEVTRPYAEKLVQQGYDTHKLFKTIGRETRTLGQYARRMPRYVNDILRQAAKGEYHLEFRHRGFEQFDRKLERGINRLTVGAVISASTIAASLILNSSQKVLEFKLPFFGHPTLSITAALGITGYVIATVLGIWLILSIFRSGRL